MEQSPSPDPVRLPVASYARDGSFARPFRDEECIIISKWGELQLGSTLKVTTESTDLPGQLVTMRCTLESVFSGGVLIVKTSDGKTVMVGKGQLPLYLCELLIPDRASMSGSVPGGLVQQTTSVGSAEVSELAVTMKLAQTIGKKAITTHKAISIEADGIGCQVEAGLRKLFPEVYLPMTGDPASLGYDTKTCLYHYEGVCKEASKLMALKPADTTKREAVSVKAHGSKYAQVFVLLWMMRGELDHETAFLLGLELYIADKSVSDKNANRLRQKMWQGLVVGKSASHFMDVQAQKEGIKPIKEHELVDGLSVFLCFEGPIVGSFAPRDPFAKNTWATGGAPAEKRPVAHTASEPRPAKATAPPAKAAASAGKRVAKAGGGAPFYPDFENGALITDYLLGQCLEALASVFPSNTRVLFPDSIRNIVDHVGSGTRTEKKRSFVDGGARIGKGEAFLAPLHVCGDHWVLLWCTPKVIKVYDSLRSHTNGKAVEFAQILATVPGFEEAVIVEDLKWPRQAEGSNDCALFVMRAVLMILSGRAQDWAVSWFTRTELDTMLPHVDREKGQFTMLQEAQFAKRMGAFLKSQPPTLAPPTDARPKRAPGEKLCTGCNDRLVDGRCRSQLSSACVGAPARAPTVPAIPAVQKGVQQTPVAGAKKARCPWPSCDAVIEVRVQCTACNVVFCDKHSRKKRGPWRCDACLLKERSYLMATLPKPPPPALPPSEEQSSGFRNGRASPLLAETAGPLLEQLKGSISKVLHPLAEKGITAQCRTEHLKLLAKISEAPKEMHEWPLARVALEMLERGRQSEDWKWATVENKSGLLAAALTRLSEYTNGKLKAVFLKHSQEWSDAGRHIRRLARQTSALGLAAMTESEMARAIETATDPDMKAFLILLWTTIGRPGDVSQVKTSGLTLGTTDSNGDMNVKVFFERGKVIGKVDPYHVHTVIPAWWAKFLRQWLAGKTTVHLFQQPSKKARAKFLASVRVHIRTVAPHCDLRSTRRGAAQLMAENGRPLEDILQFTRHTDLGMLRRYLRFGATDSTEAVRSREAARALW